MNKLKYFLLACLSAGILHSSTVTAASTSNTLVRFQFRHGTALFGNVDVELFDHDKPITVSNFLSYVRSGAFNHTFIDNVVPGYLVKGGEYKVENPYSDALLEEIVTIPEGPTITNEFNSTRVIPNTFGTLAMSLNYEGEGTNAVTIRDSGSTAWFFNTGDNSTDPNADFDNQGFVVFGRVIKGGKYLTYFNTISEDDGIVNMNGDTFLFSDCNFPAEGTNELAFTGLPVSFYAFFDGFRCPQYNDIFNVSISVLRATNVTDNAAPKLKLTHPIKSTVILTNTMTVRGTIRDTASGVDSVMVYLNTNPPVAATVTSSNTFFADITAIPAGTNTIKVEATDNNGNRLLTTSPFFFEARVPFTLLSSAGTGAGTTQGPADGDLLIIDRVYSITAVPNPTNLFVGWYSSNILISQSPTLFFFMRTNTTVYPQFDTNFFPNVSGQYNGLFLSPDAVDPAGSGFFSLKLEDSGTYSAKLLLNGSTIPFSGRFNSVMSNAFPFFSPTGLRGFTVLRMGFDILTLNDQLTGTLTNFYARISPTNENVIITNTWYANIVADRVPAFIGTNRSSHAGKYTMSFPSDGNPGSPAGDGYGLVTVSPLGGVSLAGSLADGTKVSQKVPLSKDGHWPLYLAPLKTNAAVISWVNFASEPDSDFSGLFNWFKYRHTTKYHADGFTNEAMIIGSRFTNSTGRALDLDSGSIGFTNGNLAGDFSNSITIDANGRVTNLETNRLSLSLSTGNGLMSGSVTPPSGGKSIPFKGVVIQKQTNAVGYFLGTNVSGRVQLGR